MPETTPTTAYTLSLIGGILILLGALGGFAMNMWGMAFMGGFGGMMGGRWLGWGWLGSFMIGATVFGIISGLIVIFSALKLQSDPGKHQKWGTLILVFSILSLFGAGGGFVVGLILGIIGGALAISWKPGT